MAVFDPTDSQSGQTCQVHDPVRKVGVIPDFVVESRIGGDYRVLFLNRKREIEAVIDRMVEIDSKPGCRCGKLAHREGHPRPESLSMHQ